MNTLIEDLQLEVLKYLDIKDFINVCFLNKKHLNLCKKYLKYKKREFKREKKEKTYKNCLYKLKDPTCNDEICIVKIVKVEDMYKNTGCDKKKITFWVITKMCKIGKNNEFKYYVYPNWCKVNSIENKYLIPFY
jgi:hypothetical protein